ncbi:MAG: aromatic amino acid hydroxylase [Oligoflexus sp.]|jgi:phenylalanine-4-hydroxylase
MERTLDRLPSSLRRYCIEHDAARYSPRDHAAWRYIMRRAHDFFKDHAVSTYQDGFAKVGLRVDRIPHIDEIDQALQTFGWGAVPVVGFIAPWAFIEFQARKILPIATDMRTVEHIAYTPAPDIVHEAAGHAPILPDKAYSDYLAYYASLGMKAIYSQQDLRLYEAVRYLSDLKEKPESTPAIIAGAEQRLQETLRAFTSVSEQALVARMSWWTAEYGLAGSLKSPKIYGAGLLSSVAESKMAITDQVKKIPLSIDCINYSYNITEPQPQLFVAENMQHLHDVLRALEQKLAYRIGGVASLVKAVEAQAITTLVLDTDLAVSGRLVSYEHQGERIDFVKFAGPVQISRNGHQLLGHGHERHAHGFSSPLGRLAQKTNKPLAQLSDSELGEVGLVIGHTTGLKFVSGFEVNGRVLHLTRKEGRVVMISFGDCTVRRGSQVYFEPAWGEFDLVVGDSIPSVFGGPADREAFGEHEIADATTTPGREVPYTPEELKLFSHYQTLRKLREQAAAKDQSHSLLASQLEELAQDVLKHAPFEWLLQLEIYELCRERLDAKQLQARWCTVLKQSLDPQNRPEPTRELLDEGLRLLDSATH